MKIDLLKGLQDGSIKEVKITERVLSVKSANNTLEHHKLVSLDAVVEEQEKKEESTPKEEKTKGKR